MALDFHSRITKDQKEILQRFADQEVAKAGAKKKRLDFLALRVAEHRDVLSALQQEEDLEFIASTTKTALTEQEQKLANPPKIKQRTLVAFNEQTERALAPVAAEVATLGSSLYTRPTVSTAVDDIKSPLLEAIKGRFERLEYAIRRAAMRAEALGLRATKQAALQGDISAVAKSLNPEG